ncbi:D-2-hydroxyglutarate dehydrogenase, mitochondrial [Dionaea muscipula]
MLQIIAQIFEWISKHQGSISAEHDLGLMKANEIHYSKSPETIPRQQRRMGRTTSGAEERALKVFDMECKQLATSCEELARVLQVRYRKLIQKLIQELMFLHVASEYYMQGVYIFYKCSI